MECCNDSFVEENYCINNFLQVFENFYNEGNFVERIGKTHRDWVITDGEGWLNIDKFIFVLL